MGGDNGVEVENTLDEARPPAGQPGEQARQGACAGGQDDPARGEEPGLGPMDQDRTAATGVNGPQAAHVIEMDVGDHNQTDLIRADAPTLQGPPKGRPHGTGTGVDQQIAVDTFEEINVGDAQEDRE